MRAKRNLILKGLMDTVFCRADYGDPWEDLDSGSEDDYAQFRR